MPLVALVALLGARPVGCQEREEHRPVLALPGGHTVRPGQLVDLEWSAADSISELEILLSTDGGHRYTRCISPQLDPGRRHYVWRVPDLGVRSLQLRIRFNRGGREIEGAPTSPLNIESGVGDAEPLALPALPENEPGRTSGGRAGSSPGNGASAFEATDDCDDGDDAHSTRDPALVAIQEAEGPSAPCHSPTAPPTAPAFVPMRT